MKTKNREEKENPYLLWMQSRNVRNEYKELSNEAIKAKLKEKSLPFAVMMVQLASDFNFGTLVRNANNFGCREVFYYGERKRWNRRPALGTYNYTSVSQLKTIDELVALKDRYVFVGVENNVANTVPLHTVEWNKNKTYLFCFGEESAGLTDDLLALMDIVVEIPSLGSVRSINVGSASAILMYDFLSRR